MLQAGIEPDAILKALNLDPSVLDTLAKDYHTQLRVPQGSGRPSGQWTTDGGASDTAALPSNSATSAIDTSKPAGATPASEPLHAFTAVDFGAPAATEANVVPAQALSATDFGVPASAASGALVDSPEWLTGLSPAELVTLAVAIAPAAIGGVALNLILVPNTSLRAEGAIPGQPPIHYLWHSDQRALVLSSTGKDGIVQTAIGDLGADGEFRDERGRVIGRLLPNGTVLVLLSALAAVKVREETEPDMCPEPGKDKPGRNDPVDRDFEDYVKEFVNPGNPTPRGYGYQFPNPMDGGKLVFLDDCQHRTGDREEIKRGYNTIITNPKIESIRDNIDEEWLKQSKSQLEVSVGHNLIWYFSNQIAAGHARDLFLAHKEGRENIEIRVLPWLPGQTWY